MFLQVMVLWEVACLRIKSGSYFWWNVAGGGCYDLRRGLLEESCLVQVSVEHS